MMSVGNVLVVLSAAYRGISSSSKQFFHAIELENIHRHVGLISHLELYNLDGLPEHIAPPPACL
ncbi:Uncharacterised protein [Chlamydia abortus]|nr:Uncharacterised protein [Chlamydia abortus]